MRKDKQPASIRMPNTEAPVNVCACFYGQHLCTWIHACECPEAMNTPLSWIWACIHAEWGLWERADVSKVSFVCSILAQHDTPILCVYILFIIQHAPKVFSAVQLHKFSKCRFIVPKLHQGLFSVIHTRENKICCFYFVLCRDLKQAFSSYNLTKCMPVSSLILRMWCSYSWSCLLQALCSPI